VAKHIQREVEVQVKALRNAERLPYNDLIDGEIVEAALQEESLRYRVRIYTPLITLWTFMTQVLDPDHSCRKAVRSLIAFLVSEGQPAISADTSNYCKARKRLPLSFIVRLARKLAELIEGKARTDWLWNGREVHMVDGSSVSMPDTPANQRAYPQPSNQKPGVGFPLARIVAIISLATGAVLDLAIGPCKGKRTGETSLLRSLLRRMKPGSILLGDRSFASYFGIAQLLQQQMDGVFRMHQRRRVDFRRGRCLGLRDHVVPWQKPKEGPEWMDEATYALMPEEMWVRELRFEVTRPGYRVHQIILVTTLLDPVVYTKEDLARLYLKRWNVELDLRSIKIVMQMDVLRCKTPEMVDKEIWVHVLVYNVIRRLMVTAAAENGAEPREVSFKGTSQALTAFRETLRTAAPSRKGQLWQAMFAAIAYDRVGDRPGRVEPRAKKRRPKQYDLLNTSREQARNRLLNAA
jgi:Transposase DDE domain